MCSYFGDPARVCRRTPLQIQRYVNRISRPLLDRIDIHVDAPAVKFKGLANTSAPEGESSAQIRERVVRARVRQRERLQGECIFSNAQAELDGADEIRPAYVAEAVGYRSLDRTCRA